MLDIRTMLVIGAGVLGCFGPRFLPFLFTQLQIPSRLGRYLELVVPAALGALIFPALILDYPGHAWLGIAGVVAAGCYAFFRGGLVIPVLIAFGITFAGLTWF
jgi:branched chain amino acid efflux pump